MLVDAQHNLFDVIYTKEVSRFARNTVDTLSCVRTLKSLGIGVIFLNDNIDTLNDDCELRLTIMSSIAQEESRKTSERVKWGQRRKMEQGTVFGRDLLGYIVKDGNIYINQEEVPIVKLIFHKFLNEGKGTHTIANELYAEGIYPKYAKAWSNATILKILKNEKYVGDLLQSKTITPNYLTHKKRYNTDIDSMVYIKNHHDAIIDRHTWNDTQTELKRRSNIHDRYSNRYWCSGKIFCGECNQKFVGRTKTLKNGSKYKCWRCSINAKYGVQRCNNISINDRVLTSSIGYILSLIDVHQGDVINTITNELKNLSNLDTEINNAYQQIKTIQDKKTLLIDSMLSSIISKEELSTQKEYYNQQIDRLQNKVYELQHYYNTQLNINNITSLLDFKQPCNEICHELVDRIIVYKNNTMEVHINGVPLGILLEYTTKGKLSNYTIDFKLLGVS